MIRLYLLVISFAISFNAAAIESTNSSKFFESKVNDACSQNTECLATYSSPGLTNQKCVLIECSNVDPQFGIALICTKDNENYFSTKSDIEFDMIPKSQIFSIGKDLSTILKSTCKKCQEEMEYYNEIIQIHNEDIK